MVADHVGLHPTKRRDDGVDLVSDVDAVATVGHHLLNTTHLSLDTPQTGQLAFVRYGVTRRLVILLGHVASI